MKKLAFVFVVVLMSGVTASFAQDMGPEKPDPDKMAQQELDLVNQVVPGLSDDQKSQIKASSLEEFKKMQATHEENKENMEAMREKRQELHQEKLAAYKKILTPEQYVQLLEWMVAHPHPFDDHRGKMGHTDHHHGGRGDR